MVCAAHFVRKAQTTPILRFAQEQALKVKRQCWVDAARADRKIIMNITYKYFTEVNEEFISLTNELDLEFLEKNGSIQNQYNKYNKLDGIRDIIIAYDNMKPIGCVSIKKLEENVFEVKRVYVKKEYRKAGIAKIMMKKIETIAKEKNIKTLLLETRKTFIPAISLYKSLMYVIIDNYGQYKGMEYSVCMRKEI